MKEESVRLVFQDGLVFRLGSANLFDLRRVFLAGQKRSGDVFLWHSYRVCDRHTVLSGRKGEYME